MQNIAICEDDQLCKKQLLHILNNIETTEKLHIDTFSSGEELLKNYTYGYYDLLFIDIYMPGLNGVETVTSIRKIDSDVSIAFTTNSQDYALEAYRLDVMKYLEKPINPKDVSDFLTMARLKEKANQTVTLHISGKECSLPEKQIIYIEQRNHSLFIHLTNDSILSFSGKLDEIECNFSIPPFYRCHKSYLVNLAQVSILNKKLMVFEMKNNENVYIRRGNLKEASKIYDDYIFQELKKS